jgi:hypothetical protein
MEERHGSIMPQRPERWQALVLSHLSARADGSDDYVVGRGRQNALSRPSPRGKRLDGILTTFREMQEAHTGKAQRMSPSGHFETKSDVVIAHLTRAGDRAVCGSKDTVNKY